MLQNIYFTVVRQCLNLILLLFYYHIFKAALVLAVETAIKVYP